MAAKVAKKAPRKKGGYQMPESIPIGEILTDISKGQWILGKSIGVGGFGEVYSAAPYSGKTPKDYNNVIKIEPHGNGPLFVEMHFYMRNCKSDDIDTWQKKKKLTALGMPKYVASGSHEYKNTKYRFLVIDRYGQDLWKIFEENNRRFPEHTVYKLALQIIDILEYIHHKNYVHADIKSENLLLGLKSYDQIYLVDFGLASRCTTSTELKPDPKRAHNGTLPYTSRDAHIGVTTARGDMEILAYNIILWLCGSLPWEKLNDKVAVQKEKEKAFENIDSFLKKCFHESVPQAVRKFISLVASMKFNETPTYEKFKESLIAGLKKLDHKPDKKLGLKNINISNQQTVSITTPRKAKKVVDGNRKSPRTRYTVTPSPVKDNLNDSTIGIVIDKKRGNKKDIRKALDSIDPDGEYDIKIVKKTKREESKNIVNNKIENIIPLDNIKKPPINNAKEDSNVKDSEPLSKRINKTKQKRPVIRERQIKSLNDSESASEPENLSKGTRSRLIVTSKGKTNNLKLQLNKATASETQSDEDIFDV